ncbi:MAG: DUF4139 domain-containing protein [Cyclobacteriaceae bacterium]|nr:DUF4139 domain-containing protein [Cyclobacteriaceae bacterium]
MKTVVGLFIIFGVHVALAQNPKDIKSDIGDVTVYLRGAHVTHFAKTRINAGETTLLLSNLSSSLDPSSIQVKGVGSFTLTGVNHQINYLRKTQNDHKIDSLESLIKRTQGAINLTQARKEVLSEELNLLNENKNLGGTNGSDIPELRTALQFYQTELLRIKKSQIAESDQLAELNLQLNSLRNQLNTISRLRKQPTSDVEVKVYSSKTIDIQLEVSYFTPNAGWVPSYDIRVEDIKNPIKLTYKAQVYQNTGEDWNKVKLTFSNANPNQGGTAPQLNPWYLNIVQPKNKRQNYSSVSKQLQGKVAGIAMEEPSAAKEEMLEEMVIMNTEVVESQTSFRFIVPMPYTVKSNGDRISIDLNQYQIPAKYEYYAIPKLDPDAFLMARVYDWDQYALLGGQVNLYFEDGFVGRSFLDPESARDTLDLSLGRDKSIVIERKKVDQYTRTKTVGSNKVESRGYTIEVRNKKGQEINLLLFDQVPISAHSEIEVREVKTGGAQYNTQTGELKWKMIIAPGETLKREFQFEIKHPKSNIIRIE